MKKESLPKKFIENLSEYVSIKSISTDATFKSEISKTVEFLKNYFLQSGAKVKILQKGKTNPVVFASYFVNAKLPTVLIYGHYDVQPAENGGYWISKNPFKLFENKGRLVARGIVDNKGQNLIHIFTVAKLFQENKLAYNVKFLIEGNEESGNIDLPEILKKEKQLLKSDYCIVSDGEIANNNPTLEATLRGGANIRLRLKTSSTDLHSGIFGGATPSASSELVKLLSKLTDKNGRVLAPDFYKDLPTITKSILQNNLALSKIANPLATSGTKSLLSNLKYDFYTTTGLLPTLEFTGIKTGYTGEGFANILPSTAEVRINVRTVPPQKNKKVLAGLISFIKKNIPKYVELKMHVEDHGDGAVLDTETKFAQDVRNKLKKVYKKDVLYKYVGGSIPILKDFQSILGVSVLSVSLGNDDCNMHGVDENFRIDLITKGLKFSEELFGKGV